MEHSFDVVTCGIDAVFDPDVWLTLFRHGEYLDYSNNNDPEIDEAINDSRSSVKFEDRAAAYARLQERLAATVPWFFLSDAVSAVATQPYVKGVGAWTHARRQPGHVQAVLAAVHRRLDVDRQDRGLTACRRARRRAEDHPGTGARD